LGKGQTGSGKTLAFGLTLLTRLAFKRANSNQPLALILAPTRELAMQIEEVLAIYSDQVGLRSTVLAGGMPYPPQLSALKKGMQIVVATPGRLQDHIKRGTIDLSAVEIVVLDEADQMADMGFLPVVTEVLAITPNNGQRLLFSATLDKDVDKLVKKFMRNPVTHEIAVSTELAVDMDHHVLVVDSHVKDDVIAQIASREGRTIFFVRTKHGADRLTEKLKKLGVDAGVLHGGRTQKQRMRVLEAFKIGKKRALIATDVAARGIHVDDVSLVVHIDPPETHKDYLHRAGRTARAGAKGTVVSLASSGNRKRVHNIGKEAGVKMTETRVESMHPELMRITGAQEPSGIPVTDEPTPRGERSKPGRERSNRNKTGRNQRKPKREDKPRRDERSMRDEKPKRENKKPDRDALRRKDRASKKFDKRIEKRVERSEPVERKQEREQKPNRIARRAHLQPEGRKVQTRSEKRKQTSSKSKPKPRSRKGK
jgi:superfamily II DNA/RNA helicase